MHLIDLFDDSEESLETSEGLENFFNVKKKIPEDVN